MTRVRGWAPDLCPDVETLHTPAPSGYIAWHEWAAKHAKTHRQVRCPTCGLLAIWEPCPPSRDTAQSAAWAERLAAASERTGHTVGCTCSACDLVRDAAQPGAER